MNRVQGVSNAYVDAVQQYPAEWALVALLFLLAIFIGGYYIQEKYVYKRRFQPPPPKAPTRRTRSAEKPAAERDSGESHESHGGGSTRPRGRV